MVGGPVLTDLGPNHERPQNFPSTKYVTSECV